MDLELSVMPTRAEKSLVVSEWTLYLMDSVSRLEAINKKLEEEGFKTIRSGRNLLELSSAPLKYDNAARKVGRAVDMEKNIGSWWRVPTR